ncbi:MULTISPECIES: PH domain-containing protein [unclassified Rhodococcus (in: high G+C Gram-positive bacteria)]|uniref:PH domain-containing protein n=1 Tax=unclassified Rhodococcus (in: high G+C Gram-positive bacteria) TaxID=192944 RepID=UPI00233EB206|nr:MULTISPECIES: PH domain-containing protein [unclassified Rhodococcus (in: high G+C Gram-positive bacteria)]MDC3727127.1 PH domain-containing protein [Rhodococcus sp. Rp3]WSE23953.1 PH domain-containing protein [Rhodococcus sp. PD04]
MEQEVRVEDDESSPAGPAENAPAGPAENTAATSVVMREPSWRPSPKARVLWAVSAALMWLPLVVVQVVWVLVAPVGAGWHVAAAAATVVLGGLHVAVVPVWRYRVHRWEMDETAVYTRSGWWTQEHRIAPISRIQTVDTERGPLDRWLDLTTVTVTTASAAGAVEIVGLDSRVADETVARLTALAASSETDAT